MAWGKPGVFTIVGHCKAEGCGVPMLSGHARQMGIRREGCAYHSGGGYCALHYSRLRRRRRSQGDPRRGPCVDCGAPMVTRSSFRKNPWPPDWRAHVAHQRCTVCHSRLNRDRYPATQRPRVSPEDRRTRTADEVLEEYELIRESCTSVQEAAERMGMTYAALDRALHRARKRGILALPPPAQIDRAIAKGCAPDWYFDTRRAA